MKKANINKLIRPTIMCIALTTLLACAGGNSDSSMGRGANLGIISINVTDAVVDSAKEVWVEFSGVSLQPTNGTAINITFDNLKQINLLSLQGTTYTGLVEQATVPNGSYDWMRLHVNASEDGNFDSYIKLDDGSVHELDIPSGDESGLKINTGFEVIANKPLNMMVDFDLRKSVVESNGKYKMKPVLRLVNTQNTGNIMGSIDAMLLTAKECSDSDPNTGNAVYLFTGMDAELDDIDKKSPEPVTSANVALNTTNGTYEYVLAFIPFGDYTLAFTCQADLDDPNKNDNIVFSYTENLTVSVTTEPPVVAPAR